MDHIAYIALGSNVGDRAATLLSAVKMMDEFPGLRVRRVSQFIETQPLGPDQPLYLNAAAEVQTSFSPQRLLEALNQIERSLGRDRSRELRWGPRTCDLDLLIFDQVVINTPQLVVPHPRMHERLFVLEPLAQIAPQLNHPVYQRTVAQLLADVRRAQGN